MPALINGATQPITAADKGQQLTRDQAKNPSLFQ